jgi:hypothetical protein
VVSADGTQESVERNAFRGAWRVLTRTLKRPILAVLLLNLRRSTLEGLYDIGRLRRLRWAWSNPNSGAAEYVAAVARAAATTRGPILECGSGLTTVIVGAIARRKGQQFVSLEDSAWWARHVRWSAKLAKADVDYRVHPLRAYEKFDWYEVGPPVDDIGMVICDGPPSTSRGGRFGLMPVCADHLATDAVIYLDDFDRPAEKTVTQRWDTDFGWSVDREYMSAKGSFAEVRSASLRAAPQRVVPEPTSR